MTLHQISELTLKQFNILLVNVPYVSPMLTEFGKPPELELPTTSLIRYAERCGVEVPYQVHLDILRNGVIDANETHDA